MCLYTGIVTDTGRFQFSNTTSNALSTAAELVELGVDPNFLFREIFQSDSINYLRFSGEIRSHVSFDEATGLVYAFLSQEELKSNGVTMIETEDLIDDLRTLKGHRIAALFKELEDGGIRVSLRSRKDIDIGAVARRLGGGGHRAAAGYTSRKRDFSSALEELKGELFVGGLGADTG